MFSIFSSLFFVCLVFYLDYSAFSVGQYYQGNRSANLIAIPDFFSAFLGYKYLDDVTSAIYHYPVEIYGVSVFCFAVGFIYFFREKQIHAYFFHCSISFNCWFLYFFRFAYLHKNRGILNSLPHLLSGKRGYVFDRNNFMSFISQRASNEHLLLGFEWGCYFLLRHIQFWKI